MLFSLVLLSLRIVISNFREMMCYFLGYCPVPVVVGIIFCIYVLMLWKWLKTSGILFWGYYIFFEDISFYTSKFYLFTSTLVFICMMYVSAGGHVPWHACGSLTTTLRSWFSSLWKFWGLKWGGQDCGARALLVDSMFHSSLLLSFNLLLLSLNINSFGTSKKFLNGFLFLF